MGRKSLLGDGGRLSGGGKADLVRKLQQVHKKLEGLSQDERPDGLAETAEDLIQKSLLGHKDRDVRLLVSCCLVDVLRVHAPDAPYSPDQLVALFRLLTQQLRGLSNSSPSSDVAGFGRIHYILESLATVKSCVVLVELAQQGISGGDEALLDFFDCLLDGIHENQPQTVMEWVLEALSSCLDELDFVTQPILDTVLVGLLPVTRKESAKKSDLSAALLRRCFNRICQPITQFVNGVLAGTSQGLGGVESELKEHILHVIYELHKVNPGFLLYILPNVALQLHSEDIAARGAAMSLMGRLFSSSHTDYGEKYPKAWKEFLGRFRDVEAGLRGKMIEYGAAIMQRKSALRGDLWQAVGLRLTDPEWEIRRKAVHEICDLSVHSIDAVSADLLKQIGDRLKDKKPQIRKETATGLAQVYAAHASKKWVALVAAEDEGEGRGSQESDLNIRWPPPATTDTDSLESKLSWIPASVVKCYAYPELEMRSRVTQLLDDVILPKQGEAMIRAKGFTFIWRGLDSHSRVGVGRILQDRIACQNAVQKYLDVRKAMRLRRISSSSSALKRSHEEENLDEVFENILDFVPCLNRKESPLQRLHAIRDEKVFSQLGVVCDPLSLYRDIVSAREDLFKRVGSKTLLGEYLRVLTRSASLLSTSIDTLECILDIAIQNVTGDSGEGAAALEILSLCGDVCAAPFHTPAFRVKLQSLYTVMTSRGTSESLRATLLRLMARAGAPVSDNANGNSTEDNIMGTPGSTGKCDPNHELSRALRSSIVHAQSAQLAEGGVLAAKNSLLPSHAEALAKSAIHDLAGRRGALFSGSSKHHAMALRSLGYIAEHFPVAFHDAPERDAAIQFAQDVVSERRAGSGGADDVCASLELLTRRLLPLPIAGVPSDDSEGGAQQVKNIGMKLLDLLFSSLEGDRSSRVEPWASFDEEGRRDIRTQSALCALRLMTNAHIQGLLSVTRWHTLGFTLLDPDDGVRSAFGDFLRSAVSQALLHMKFASYLCLTAGQPSAKESEAALAMGTKRMREIYAQRSQADAASVMHLLPENILSYTIHLLSHHPDFDDGLSDRALQRSLSLLLSALIGQDHHARGRASGNLSSDSPLPFLQKIAETVLTSYCDSAPGADLKRLRRVAEAAADVIDASIDTSFDEYPETIYLPKNLFRQRVSSDPSPPRSRRKKAAPVTSWQGPSTAQKRKLSKSSRLAKGDKGRGAPKMTVRASVEKRDFGASESDSDDDASDFEELYAKENNGASQTLAREARAAARAAARSGDADDVPRGSANEKSYLDSRAEEDAILRDAAEKRPRLRGLR